MAAAEAAAPNAAKQQLLWQRTAATSSRTTTTTTIHSVGNNCIEVRTNLLSSTCLEGGSRLLLYRRRFPTCTVTIEALIATQRCAHIYLCECCIHTHLLTHSLSPLPDWLLSVRIPQLCSSYHLDSIHGSRYLYDEVRYRSVHGSPPAFIGICLSPASSDSARIKLHIYKPQSPEESGQAKESDYNSCSVHLVHHSI